MADSATITKEDLDPIIIMLSAIMRATEAKNFLNDQELRTLAKALISWMERRGITQ